MSYAVRRPCSDFMDMLRRLINYRIIIIIIKYKWGLGVFIKSNAAAYSEIFSNLPGVSSLGSLKQKYVQQSLIMSVVLISLQPT